MNRTSSAVRKTPSWAWLRTSHKGSTCRIKRAGTSTGTIASCLGRKIYCRKGRWVWVLARCKIARSGRYRITSRIQVFWWLTHGAIQTQTQTSLPIRKTCLLITPQSIDWIKSLLRAPKRMRINLMLLSNPQHLCNLAASANKLITRSPLKNNPSLPLSKSKSRGNSS